MSSRVLITGATGFLGREIYNQASTRGFELVELGRKQSSNASIAFHKVDFNEQGDLSEALQGVDTVIHCAAKVPSLSESESSNDFHTINLSFTEHLATEASKAGVRRFIFISSIKVNGERTEPNIPFTAFDEHKPQDLYGESKSQSEKSIINICNTSKMEFVIVRPPLVYGPGVKANFNTLLKLASFGVPLPFAGLNSNKRDFVSTFNVADLVITCIENFNAANQVFLVSDDNSLSTSALVRKMSKFMNKSSKQLFIPVALYTLLGKITKKEEVIGKLTMNLELDISHTKQTLNWTPPKKFEDALKSTITSFLVK